MARIFGQAIGSKLRLATVLGAGTILAGCSWLGGHSDGGAHYSAAQHGGAYGNPYGGHGAYGAVNPCQIPHAQAPVPVGCNPATVTIGTGAFPQQPQFGAPVGGSAGGYSVSYATAGYGSHAGNAGSVTAGLKPGRDIQKSRLRGSLSLGVEKSVMGTYLDSMNGIPFAYDPTVFDVITDVNPDVAPADGDQITQIFTAREDGIFTNTISHDDVHSTPLSLGGGLEYGLTPRLSVFGNAAYTYAEGQSGTVARVEGFVDEVTVTDTYVGGNLDSTVTDTAPGTTVQTLATVDYAYSDMNRVDLEVGGRYYFSPLHEKGLNVTPFVSAAVGASRHNAQSAEVTQTQLDYANPGNPMFEVRNPGGVTTVVDIYDGQWVPTGNLRAGVEWQATPRAALAFESGVRFEGGREYVNGNDEDSSLAIPFTVRGSFNF